MVCCALGMQLEAITVMMSVLFYSRCSHSPYGGYHNWRAYSHSAGWAVVGVTCIYCSRRCSVSSKALERQKRMMNEAWKKYLAQQNGPTSAS